MEGSSFSAAWAWCILLSPFFLRELFLFLRQCLAKCHVSSHVKHLNLGRFLLDILGWECLPCWWFVLHFLDCTMRAWYSSPSFTLLGGSCSESFTKYSLNPIICLEAPLSIIQSLLPWVMFPIREEINTYSSSLEESSLSYLVLFLEVSSSSAAWAWCLLLFPFFL